MDIQGIACFRFKCADSTFAKDDVLVPFGHDVFSRHQPFIVSCRQTTLQQDRRLRLADFFQQIEILHVTGADLDHIDIRLKCIYEFRGHQFGNDRQARRFLSQFQQTQTFQFQSLEAVWGCARLEGSTAEEVSACRFCALRDADDLFFTFNGTRPCDHSEVSITDTLSVNFDDCIVRMEFTVCFFVRLLNFQHAFDDMMLLDGVHRYFRSVPYQTQYRHCFADYRTHDDPFVC